MAKTRTLQVVISGDAKQLTGAFGKIDRAAAQSETRLTRYSKNAAKGFAALGVAAGGAAAVGLKKSVDAAIEAEKSQARLQAQLKAMNISYRAHAKEIDNVIQKTSKLSGLDDEDLQDAFTNIVRATGSVKTGMRDMALVADLARAKHLDVAKAGEIVAKVHNGNIGVLSRYGITLKKGTSAQEALATLQKRFSGQAEAYGKTVAGSSDRASVAMENLGEIIGAKVSPLVAKGANALVDLIDKSGQLAGPIRNASGAAVDAYNGMSRAVRRFVDRNRESFNEVGRAARRIATVLKDAFEAIAPVVARIAGIVARHLRNIARVVGDVIGVIVALINGDWHKAWSRAGRLVKDFANGALQTIKDLGGLMLDAAKTVGGAIGRGLLAGFKAVWNAGASAINSAIPDKISIPGPLPDINLPNNPVPTLATGGVVHAPGTSGDVIPARLKHGEVVLNERQQAMVGAARIFGALAATGGQVVGPGGTARLASGGVIGPQAVSRMQSAARRWVGLPYVYGGGHGGGFGPTGGGFDCSGFVSAVLGAGGAISSPMAVRQPLQGALLPGPGKYVTVGIRGTSGRSAHTAIKVGNRYFEAASRGVVESGGWRGSFDLFHPANEATGSGSRDPGQKSGAGSAGGRHRRRRRRGSITVTGGGGMIPGVGAIGADGSVDDSYNASFTPIDLGGGAISDPGTGAGGDVGGGPTDDPLADAINAQAEALKQNNTILGQIRDEMKRQSNFSDSVANITSREAVRALADVISGQIYGHGYQGRALTAGAGSVVRY